MLKHTCGSGHLHLGAASMVARMCGEPTPTRTVVRDGAHKHCQVMIVLWFRLDNGLWGAGLRTPDMLQQPRSWNTSPV